MRASVGACFLAGFGLAPLPRCLRTDALVATAEPGTGSCMTSTEYITAYPQTADKRLDLAHPWAMTQGANVTGAVVDSGISPASKHRSPVSPAPERGQD